MHPWQTKLAHQLEELHLIQCSLLPGERFAFVLPPEDFAIWTSLLDAFTDASGDQDGPGVIASLTHPPCQPRFEVRVVGVQTWFEVALPRCTDEDADGDRDSASGTTATISVSVKGEHISRDAHERWNAEIRTRMVEIDETCTFPAYEVLTQLTTTLHQSQDPTAAFSETISSLVTVPAATPSSLPVAALAPQQPHHALLTSHHLISPNKRRTLHHLSSQFDITGFAKVGYPGIIYAEGPREGVEAFVREVKGMQWLALRTRFVEPVPVSEPGSGSRANSGAATRRDWVEVSKVGEVVAWMRVRGREGLVTSLGIGAPLKK